MDALQKLDTLQTIELAEGVQVHLHPAGPVPRALALLLDYFMMFLIIAATVIVFAFFGIYTDPTTSIGMILIIVFATYWGYFVLFEVLRRGQTPGKKWLGLRVVRTSGAPVGWGASFLRNLVRFADMMPLLPQWQAAWLVLGFYLVGVATCLSNRKFQRLGDIVGDTIVIYDRTAPPDFSRNMNTQIAGSAPPVVLTREEQAAFIQFTERAATWSDSRKEEIISPVNEVLQSRGRDAVVRAVSIGIWLRDS